MVRLDPERLIVWAALAVGAFVLASLLSFTLAVHPPRLRVPLAPADFRLTVEAVTIRSDDGLALAGWLLPRPGAPAVVLLHGYPAEKADMLPIAAMLHPRFTVLLLDLRYFGASEGRVTTLGLRERRDLRRALDFLAARGYAPAGVFGFSLGGAVALLTAGEDARVRAVAAYAPFSDLEALGHELYGWMWLLKHPFVGLMRVWSRLFLGGDVTRPAPATVAATLAIPVLLIASRQDEQIPFRHAERLRAALARNPRAEFLFMDRGRHGVLPDDFEARLTAFFLAALR